MSLKFVVLFLTCGSTVSAAQSPALVCTTSYKGTPSCTFDRGACSFSSSTQGLPFVLGGSSTSAGPLEHDWRPPGAAQTGSYIYPKIKPTSTSSTATLFTTFSKTVTSVCIEFHYASTGLKNHTVRVSLESEKDSVIVLELKEVNTNNQWKLAVVPPVQLPQSSKRIKILFEVDNLSDGNLVALDYIKVTNAQMSRHEGTSTRSTQKNISTTKRTFVLSTEGSHNGFPKSSEQVPSSTRHSISENLGPGTPSITPVSSSLSTSHSAVSHMRTSDVTTRPPKLVAPVCTNSFTGTPSCTFDFNECAFVSSPGGLPFVLGGESTSPGPLSTDWRPPGATRKGSYIYPKTDPQSTSSKAKLYAIFALSVKSVCIEFHYATTGKERHTIRVALSDGIEETTVHELNEVNTKTSWELAVVQPVCIPQGAKIFIEVNNLSPGNIVALDYIKITNADMSCSGKTSFAGWTTSLLNPTTTSPSSSFPTPRTPNVGGITYLSTLTSQSNKPSISGSHLSTFRSTTEKPIASNPSTPTLISNTETVSKSSPRTSTTSSATRVRSESTVVVLSSIIGHRRTPEMTTETVPIFRGTTGRIDTTKLYGVRSSYPSASSTRSVLNTRETSDSDTVGPAGEPSDSTTVSTLFPTQSTTDHTGEQLTQSNPTVNASQRQTEAPMLITRKNSICSNSFKGTPSCTFDNGVCSFFNSSDGLPFVLGGATPFPGPLNQDWRPPGPAMQGSYIYPAINPSSTLSKAKVHTVLSTTVTAVCMEFHYATTGQEAHTIRVSVSNGRTESTVHELVDVKTQSSWETATLQPTCLPGGRHTYISIEVDNLTPSSLVALDYIKITEANIQCPFANRPTQSPTRTLSTTKSTPTLSPTIQQLTSSRPTTSTILETTSPKAVCKMSNARESVCTVSSGLSSVCQINNSENVHCYISNTMFPMCTITNSTNSFCHISGSGIPSCNIFGSTNSSCKILN